MITLLNKSLITALSFLFFITISPVSSAAENPFGMSDMATDQIQLSGKDGKCGEGKCGDSKKAAKCGEGKCGDSKKEAKGGKCGDSKKEAKGGKCGDSKKEAKGGKCGEGKCGEGKKAKCGS